jgi:DNA-binding beta-propeller fold protein YncE
MKKIAMTCVAAALLASGIARAHDDDDRWDRRDSVKEFVTLPKGVSHPEGITANPQTGEIYVGTFNPGGNNYLLRYSRHGKLIAQREFGGAPLLGLAFDSLHRKVYIANAGTLAGVGVSRVQRIPADFNSTTPIEEVAAIPSIFAPGPRTEDNPDGSKDTITFGSNGAPAPNAMDFDKAGRLYVSDSFQGAIFYIDNAAGCVPTCSVKTLVHDPLLATAGFPPFGANGVALSSDGKTLFVANTGDDRVLKVDLATKGVSVFAESINGADGVAFDEDGRLWVAANQNDEVVALNRNGRVIARLGEFRGIDRQGAPRGLLFPASLVIVDDWMYVTNLALPLTGATGDEPEEKVTLWTVSRIRIPSR